MYGMGSSILRNGIPAREPRLGILGLDVEAFSDSILLGGAGVGVLAVARLLPEPADTVALVGGIGLLGWSLLNLLGDGKRAAQPTALVYDPGKVVNKAIYPPLPFRESQKIDIKINSPVEGPAYTFLPWDDDIDVEGEILYTGGNKAGVTLVFEVEEVGRPRNVVVTREYVPFEPGKPTEFDVDVKFAAYNTHNILNVYYVFDEPQGEVAYLARSVDFIVDEFLSIWPRRETS